jgi:rubrerythrin
MATALAVSAIATIPAGRAVAEEGATYRALQVAYGREMNTRLKYQAFAARAEREGHDDVACLFRAVARGESVHASHFSGAIDRLGGTAQWQVRSVTVRDTRENLRAAIGVERMEWQGLYPHLADLARAEYLYDPLAWFNYARGAEATHAGMFAAALARLDRAPAAAPPAVVALLMVAGPGIPGEPDGGCYVCLECGSVYPGPVKSCANCGTAGGRFARFACTGP